MPNLAIMTAEELKGRGEECRARGRGGAAPGRGVGAGERVEKRSHGHSSKTGQS
jgi:hypothetical protein